MLVQSATVVNNSDRAQWLKDRQIPGGRVRLEPGATLLVSYGVWLRNRRSCRAWLGKLDDSRVLAHSLKSEKPMTSVTDEPVSIEEPVTEPMELEMTSEETEQVDESIEQTDSDGLEGLKVKDLKPIGEALGIEWKPGMSADNYREIIREKQKEGAINETE